jgi:photosystem II stability/assembly factor-like uncharacterized protein
MSTPHWIAATGVGLASAVLILAQDRVYVSNATPWTALGPAPIGNQNTGRVSAIVCSATDPDRYWIGGADGGVWRTLDGGASWTPLTDDLPTTSIGALALDSSNEDVLFAGTGEANYANHSRYGLGIYRSLDGGDTWDHFGQSTFGGRTISALTVDHEDGRIVYAAVARAGGFPELAAGKGHPGATGAVGVFKSTDRGETWVQLGGGLPGVEAMSFAMDPNDSNVLYAGIGRVFGHVDNGVYKSTDAGASWNRAQIGIPFGANIGRVNVAVAPSNGSRLYALITNDTSSTGSGASTDGGYRSSDGGATWSLASPGSIQSSFGWYYSLVTVDPTDDDTVFMGGQSFHRSTNSGSNWSTVTPLHVDMHAAAWDANGRLVVGDDGGVHRSTNLGSSWTALNDGLGLIQFYAGISSHPSDDEHFIGGTQDNGTNQLASGTWQHVYGGDGGWTQIDQTSPNRLFVEFQGTGNLYRSTTGGTSFFWAGSGLGGNNAFLPPYLIDPSDPQRMFYGSDYISRSTDGGSSWSPISAGLSTGSGAIRALAMSHADTDVLWAATNDGNVLISTDGGFQWAVRIAGNPGWPRVTREIFTHPTQPLTAWLAVASFGVDQIRKTTDGGLNFVALDGDLPDLPVNTVAALPGVVDELFAGTDAGLYHSPNGGKNWRRYGRGLPNVPVIDILLEPARERVVVATQGRGLWSAALDIEGLPATKK